MKHIELLAPVGKFENALAAIENGADAIFVGGKAFNARQYANNFDGDELKQIVEYCKLRNVKTHITVNTLIKEDEIEELVAYLGYLYHLGVDAVIVQDFGVARIVKTYFPELEMHASTQMTAHSLEDVKFLESCGFSRVVLARELQLKDIAYIKQHTQLEIETFIHGALCYAYSGQCILSSMIGGRSGNRGRCAQPCRMTYSLYKDNKEILNNLHLLSPKDMSTLEILPSLIACGIDSFKIEGRMKSPEYVASVTRIYRKYIDLAVSEPDNYKIEEEDFKELQSIFNRGGFSEGYYHQKSGKDMLTEKTPKNIGLKIGYIKSYNPKKKIASIYTERQLNPGDGLEIWNKKTHSGVGISKTYEAGKVFDIRVEGWVDEGSMVYLSKNHTLLKTLKKTYEKAKRKNPIDAYVKGLVGEPLMMRLACGQYEALVYGEVLEEATNKPLTSQEVEKQMMKFGSTPFEVKTLELDWPANGYMPISSLNALRREAAAKLEAAILNVPKRVAVPYEAPQIKEDKEEAQYIGHVLNLDQLEACLKQEQINPIYWEWQYNTQIALQVINRCSEVGKTCYLVLPHIVKDKLWKKYKEEIQSFKNTEVTGFVIRTYGGFECVKDLDKKVVIDHPLNIMNNETISHWLQKGAVRLTPSLELAKDELDKLKGPLEKVIYGHMPVMTTEQCVLGNFGHCIKNQEHHTLYTLQDRKEVKWPLLTDCVACKMQVLMEKPIFILPEKFKDRSVFSYYRLVFTQESGKEVEEICVQLFSNKMLNKPTQLGVFIKPIE